MARQRQRNYCVKLPKRSKKEFYNNLNVTDNKNFWKTIKPNFANKILMNEKIILVEDYKVVTAETDFENIVESLQIECPCKVDLDWDPVVSTIKNFSPNTQAF